MEQNGRKEGGSDQATYRSQEEIMNMRESTDRERERECWGKKKSRDGRAISDSDKLASAQIKLSVDNAMRLCVQPAKTWVNGQSEGVVSLLRVWGLFSNKEMKAKGSKRLSQCAINQPESRCSETDGVCLCGIV